MKKLTKLLGVVTIGCLCALTLTACNQNGPHGNYDLRDDGVIDTALPVVGQDGWYSVFVDNFERDSLNDGTQIGSMKNADGTDGTPITTDIWQYSPHNKFRWETQTGDPKQTSYWCPNMVSLKDGKVEMKAYETDDHNCNVCPQTGRFSGGIETRKTDLSGNMQETFSQAYGYFETKVKFPDADGLWSAFWLQATNQKKISHEGTDGTEIDVYESAFQKNPTRMGHALLWNGYGKYNDSDTCLLDSGTDLYEGYHTFALKWTPEYYVFYIDGKASWASMGGGVSKVKEFLRLTVEMDAGDGWGPHGQKIGKFKSDLEPIFYVDEVKVYQNTNFQKYIVADDMFSAEVTELVK